MYYFNRAIGHAAARGLTYPNKSSILRSYLQKSGRFAKAGDAAPVIFVDLALFDGFLKEVNAMNHGECQ